jgi:cytochrome c-type biogenesis protein CcmH
MAWIVVAILVVLTLGLMIWLGKLPRQTWEAAAAALVLGLVGYAVQGLPDLGGSPAVAAQADSKTADALILARSEMDRQFSTARPYLVTSDAFARDGDYKLAASYIKSGIRKNPAEADLWSGLGLQLMLASDGKMSAPAKYAFDQVRKFNPRAPAPDYFKGLVALFDGKPDETLKLWKGLLANAPKEAKWKDRLESQVLGLETLLERQSIKSSQ